ncbi:DUF5701 family protein [Patescibacteria group bacterium]
MKTLYKETEVRIMNKLSTDQLADELVSLFRNIYTTTNIEEAIRNAKGMLLAEAKKARRKQLEELFDAQIQRWKDCGCPGAIVEMLADQKDAVLSRAREMTFGEGNISILSVVPRIYMTIYNQMPMVKNGEKTGFTHMDPTEITDVVDVPKRPYWIYDVENGEARLGESPEKAEKLIKKEGQSCLTDTEVIAIGIHDRPDHHMDATGSCYGLSDRALCLHLDEGCPVLDWHYAGASCSRWGSASCGSR